MNNLKSVWGKVAEKLESGNLENLDISKIPDKWDELSIGGTSVSLKFALKHLLEASQFQDSNKLMKEVSNLHSQVQEKTIAIKKLESKHNNQPSLGDSETGLVDRTVFFLWPYVLVLMLGLKLARTNYIGDI